MMSQTNLPIHSYENDQKSPHPYYQLKIKTFENLYLANETRCIDLDVNLRSSICNSNGICNSNNTSFNNCLQSLENLNFCVCLFWQTNYFFFDCLFVCLENLAVQPNYENLAVQPNSEKPGSPNSPTNKKIFLSSFKYDLLNKHAKRSDQQMGGALPVLSGAHLHLKGALPYLGLMVHLIRSK